jgi:hypothetical protein
VGETFLLFEKITSPTHYANFASLICFVRRGIICKSIEICHKVCTTSHLINVNLGTNLKKNPGIRLVS